MVAPWHAPILRIHPSKQIPLQFGTATRCFILSGLPRTPPIREAGRGTRHHVKTGGLFIAQGPHLGVDGEAEQESPGISPTQRRHLRNNGVAKDPPRPQWKRASPPSDA